jgi:hypothetical protein
MEEGLVKARLIATMLAGLSLETAGTAWAKTSVNGEYQLQLDARKTDRAFPWDWQSNHNDTYSGAQLWLFAQPRPTAETFFKIEADWNESNNNNRRPEFQFREAHARFFRDLGGRGFESYLFFRQDRFWVDNYLFKAVEGGALRDDGNAQGVRVNTWGFWGLNASLIASDRSGQFNPTQFPAGLPRDSVADARARQTDDAYVVRLRRELFDQALRIGTTWNRVEENAPGETRTHAQVFAFDTRYRWRGTDFSLEYAQSASPLDRDDGSFQFPEGIDRPVTVFGTSTGLELPERSVLLGEIRAISFGTTRWGYLNLVPSYWHRGALFENRAGDGGRDEVGFNLNGWYLLPDRAITLTGNYKKASKAAQERRSTQEIYYEMYVEFVNGFTGKTSMRQQDITVDRFDPLAGEFRPFLESHDDLFAELQVESRLAWMRVQGKLRDLNTPLRQELVALEARLNLTSTIKSYNRFVMANDPSVFRKAVFTQLQYRPTDNMEVFLEYGPGWIGDDSTPVNDGDLQGGSDQRDLLKLILKGRF